MNSGKIDSSFFDTVYDREHTGSIKYDKLSSRGRYQELIPMWIADMDFKVHTKVEEALLGSEAMARLEKALKLKG